VVYFKILSLKGLRKSMKTQSEWLGCGTRELWKKLRMKGLCYNYNSTINSNRKWTVSIWTILVGTILL